MYKRSELRKACYRAKNNAITDDIQPLLDIIQPLLGITQNWSNFSVEWDLILGKDGSILIIKPETDYSYIHTICLQCAMYKKKNFPLDDFTERDLNIVTVVENLMLDKLMTWDTYSKKWGVEIDLETKSIRTKLYNVSSNQLEVTEEMIRASTKDGDGTALSLQNLPVVALDMQPADPDAIKQMIGKMYPKP